MVSEGELFVREREDSQWGRWNPVLVRRLQWKVGRQTRIKRGAFIRVMQEVGRMAGIEFNGEMRFPKAKQVGLIVEYCEVWSEELRRT